MSEQCAEFHIIESPSCKLHLACFGCSVGVTWIELWPFFQGPAVLQCIAIHSQCTVSSKLATLWQCHAGTMIHVHPTFIPVT